MQKIFIKNRNGQRVSVIIEKTENQKGLAFVMHGLGGFKEQDHIATFASAFREKEFTVIRFDTTNTLGESDGKYEDATIMNYYEDLEDVIKWAEGEEWYQEPFVLSGHSLGGICSCLYAEKYPEKVLGLAPISSVISGQLILDAEPKERVAEWNKTGWKISPSESRPGIIKKLNWHKFVDDSLRYDILEDIDKLTMPVLLIVGSEDHGTPYEHQKMLYEKLSGAKEIHVIDGAPHTFRGRQQLDEIRTLFLKWIDKELIEKSK